MLILALLSLAAAPQADREGSVLTPVAEGLLRCTAPDRGRKTCSSLSRFTLRPDGSFDADVTGLASAPARITVQYRTEGRVIGNAACFVYRAGMLNTASFSKPDARLAASLQDTLRAALAREMAPLAGKQRCYHDRNENGVLTSATTLDGVSHPELDRPVIWVSPDDGYTVG